MLRNLVSSSKAAELFLLRLPSADIKVRFDLERGFPPCWLGEAQGSMLLVAVLLEVAFTRLVRSGVWGEGFEGAPEYDCADMVCSGRLQTGHTRWLV